MHFHNIKNKNEKNKKGTQTNTETILINVYTSVGNWEKHKHIPQKWIK